VINAVQLVPLAQLVTLVIVVLMRTAINVDPTPAKPAKINSS